MNYHKLLLDELRLVVYEKGDAPLTEALLTKAVTLNENLKALGYTLSPADIAALAVSPSLDGFYETVKGMLGTADAAPMYPGFPRQVMELEEAVLRFHQAVHYFSTYGLELLFGGEVQRGWLPCPGDGGKKAGQDTVLPEKVIRLLPAGEAYLEPLGRILSRRERMTLPERQLVRKAMANIAPEEAASLTVPFKENLKALYAIVFDLPDRESAMGILRGLCKHTGDVLACIGVLLGRHRFHFRTSQKRFLVKLLESYPAADLRANLVLSGRNARRNIVLLNYIDYSVYSRSEAHMEAVNALRDGKLRSWESVAKAMLTSGAEGTLDFLAQRPGMMLRMVAWLLRSGYDRDAILARLTAKAEALSLQTLVTNLNYFGKLTGEERADAATLFSLFEQLLRVRMAGMDTVLRGKKVALAMPEFDLEVSELHCNDRSPEGGFIRSGIAYRLPEGIEALRFFVYWNDKTRVDIDLHAGYTDLDGQFHHVGWNRSFRDGGVVFSGDITHSNAAEYIDIDLSAPIDKVNANIHLYSGKPGFQAVDTCYVGMQAIPKGQRDGYALFKEANCFFSHRLRQDCATIHYGYIDVPNRCIVFDGVPRAWDYDWYGGLGQRRGAFSLRRYLELLLEAQQATVCDVSQADVVLVMGKASSEKELSLVDANFFLEQA